VTVVDEIEAEDPLGEVPDAGPEVFRNQPRRAARQDPDDGAHVTLHDEGLDLADIESAQAEDEQQSRVTLRNGVIIAGMTGAAIVAALTTIRFRRRRRS
jgi:hypothetical protein